MVLKGGIITTALMGDPNASIPTPQPVHYRDMFGTRAGRLARGSLTFVSQIGTTRPGIAASDAADPSAWYRSTASARRASRTWCTTTGCRTSMSIPKPIASLADGQELICEPARVLPMAQRYFCSDCGGASPFDSHET